MSHDDIFNSRYGPRIARGGIKSQTSRGAFGKSWWAQRWIKYLEAFDLGGRLARGRTYARHGQVLSIDVQEGVITASVQGSRKEPYSVKIEVSTIGSEKWDELSKTDFSQAIIAAKLLAGEMPADIEKVFEKHGVSLFPRKVDDLKTYCSCPDFSNPCKHIASVYYLLGEEFDRDPFLIFRMRGMAKEKLIGLITRTDQPLKGSSKAKTRKVKKVIQETQSDIGSEPDSETTSEIGSDSALLATAEQGNVPLDLQSFWNVQKVEDVVGPAVAPATNANFLKRLGPISFWRSSHPFMSTMEEIYKVATAKSVEILVRESDQST